MATSAALHGQRGHPAVRAPMGPGRAVVAGGFVPTSRRWSPPLVNLPLHPEMLTLETSPEDVETSKSAVHCYATFSSVVWK